MHSAADIPDPPAAAAKRQRAHNPFRIGTAFIAWRRRPDELYVPVRFLTVRPHPLVHCIAALVRRHGGSVEIEPPWVTIKPPRR